MTINIPTTQLVIAVSIFLSVVNVMWMMANCFYSYTLRKGETSRIRAIVKSTESFQRSNGELIEAISRMVGSNNE